MRTVFRSAVAAAAVALAWPAVAASVAPVNGAVLVNRGQGFRQISGATTVSTGDTIMVRPGGSARITYPGGCWIPVEPGNVLTVPPEDHCVLGLNNVTGTDLLTGAAIAGAIAGGVLLLHGDNGATAPASP